MTNIRRFFPVLVLAIFIFPLLWVGSAQADVYSSYKKLASRQDKNQDYCITSYNGPSSTAVIAIHGGKIETGTSQLAKSVANHIATDLYTFEGIKKSNNGILHITSARFDEPIAKKLVAESRQTLAIHGCRGSSKITYVGGLDKKLAGRVKTELKKAGFKVATPPSRLAGTHHSNIVNENMPNKGVQLELTYSLRQTLLKNSKAYSQYVKALATALE